MAKDTTLSTVLARARPVCPRCQRRSMASHCFSGPPTTAGTSPLRRCPRLSTWIPKSSLWTCSPSEVIASLTAAPFSRRSSMSFSSCRMRINP